MFNNENYIKVNNKRFEVSLIKLLNKEDACVTMLNESYRALDIAKKGGLRSIEYEREIKINSEKLKECRNEIKEYFKNNILNLGGNYNEQD